MDTIAAAEIGKHLKPGEKLIWAERPNEPHLKMNRMHWMIGIALCLLLPVLFFVSMAVADGQYDVWGAVGRIAVVLAALAFMGATTLWGGRHSGRTYYGVTDQRAIIVETGFRGRVKSYDNDNINQLWLKETDPVFSDLFLRREGTGDGAYSEGFVAIRDGQMVKELIERYVLTQEKLDELNRFENFKKDLKEKVKKVFS